VETCLRFLMIKYKKKVVGKHRRSLEIEPRRPGMLRSLLKDERKFTTENPTKREGTFKMKLLFVIAIVIRAGVRRTKTIRLKKGFNPFRGGGEST